jgi:hypothetical protein
VRVQATPRRLVAASLLALTAATEARAAPDADVTAALELGGGADVVGFDLPAPAGAPHVRAATTARAPAALVTAILLDPAHFGAIVPSLVRADVEGPAEGAAQASRRLAWELEVPLFNLKGHMALRALPDGVEMLLVDGDLAPGRVTFRVAARPDGRTTLEADAVLDVRHSSFFVRTVMARSPVGEPAALAAAIWAVTRATALRAEHARDSAAFRPTAPPAAPESWPPDARTLADPRLEPLWARGLVAFVARAGSERLAGVSVAGKAQKPVAALGPVLRDPGLWRSFPGWLKVEVVPTATPNGLPSAKVEDSIPFVDLDATWQGLPGPAMRWMAIEGAARGARLGWDVVPAEGGSSIVVLRMHPRLEQTGGIPRRFIEAEPLLEHGLSLAIAFASAWGTIGSWTRPPAKTR